MKKIIVILFLVLCAGFFSCSKKETTETIPSVLADAPLAYVLEDISGTVLVQSAGASQTEPAEEEQTVRAGDEIITQAGSEVNLNLNEITMIHLSENSDVKVDQLARNATQGFITRLKLLAGKILSAVEKLDKSHSSFEVEAGGVVCGVRGTVFEVENQDSDVYTTTYEGVVEMKKDNNTQTVEVNERCGYSLGQNGFLPKRAISPEEKAHYEDCKSKLVIAQGKTRERMETLRSIDRLPAEQKQQILRQSSGVNEKDRIKTIRQIYQNRQIPSNFNRTNPSRPGFQNSNRLSPGGARIVQPLRQVPRNIQAGPRVIQRPVAAQPGKKNQTIRSPKAGKAEP
jgi:hypothetical protein